MVLGLKACFVDDFDDDDYVVLVDDGDYDDPCVVDNCDG